ncbi:ubiquitin [Acidianus manzaensis]|uniref:Ubiquitin n=1 Tax=Acidianus manzaensis TaxID=282676 RepID=A0A1W6K041_9CREN|nr:ubiquitin [Acidianus manzaensis]ARM75879.1 hypothetical protein B6F84_07430 [Acidianus manzaensis]
MTKVILLGPLSQTFGFKEKEIQANTLFDIINAVDSGKHILIDGEKIRSGFIILIDGIDSRLYSNANIKQDSVISIIPVNHGG